MTVMTYVVTFSVTSANLFNFEQFLKTHQSVWSYWNYVPLVYCFKSPLTASALASLLGQHFPGGNFFIAEINPANINGVLPAAAWGWFYAEAQPRQPLGMNLFHQLQKE